MLVTIMNGGSRELLMCRRLLGIQCKDENEFQQEGIFQIRCLVLGNLCSLIIDGDVVQILLVVDWLKSLGLKLFLILSLTN